MAVSEEFAELRGRGDVRPGGQMVKEIAHPGIGLLRFESTQPPISARPDLTTVMHNPVPGTDTAEKLERLASPEGWRETIRPVAS
ncbi:hypothetical protein [Streptantibioticus ferralitis]|uniref:MmyB-like transcription regulator ligand binding domain-containing protein n=1 Tax=Streptantibioticus ferralitis TaxID=236510 RepID=A0ABT5Z2J5_9ACTN|nr:hypothetical protein [Streptantibioticus ferralitis]